MKIILVKDLELDVLENEYVEIPLKIHLKSGEIIEKPIDGYTHDEDPFCNYIEIEEREIPFHDVEKIEILD